LNFAKTALVFLILLSVYIVSTVYLDDVKILGGNITPVVNYLALTLLAIVGIVAGLFLIKSGPQPFSFLSQPKRTATKRDFLILAIILIVVKLAAFLLSPKVIQYMWVWPDGAGFLLDMEKIIKVPASISGGYMKSPFYSGWLALNYLFIGQWLPSLGNMTTIINTTVSLNNIVPPIFLQNVLGIASALICFSIFSRINIKLAYIVTLLSFVNPTTFALDNTVLRESLALFFILSGFVLLLKSVERKKSIHAIISGILFAAAYQDRPELVIIYILLCLVVFLYIIFQRQKIWKVLVMFCLPLIVSMFFSNNLSPEYAMSTNKGRFGIAMHGLKAKCYSYKSPAFPRFIESMQARLLKCEKERCAPCEAPCYTWQQVWFATDEEKAKYNASLTPEELTKYVKIESDDQIFLDIAKHNTFSFLQSFLINVGYNLIHNVENLSVILYDGNDYWISQNWIKYASPKVLVFYEKPKRYHSFVIAIFRAIDLHTTRKILFPFFLIGTLLILKAVRKKLFSADGRKFLLVCVIAISWVHLLAMSLLAYPAARSIYVLVPFIFVTEIIGLIGVCSWLKNYFFPQVKIFFLK
jgi:hypothetical protein